MATWNYDNVVITQKGSEALSKVQMGVGKLTVSKVVTGAGFVSPSKLVEQTEVTNVKQTLTILKVSTDSAGSELSLSLSNADLTEAYDLYQIGVYCTHPDFADEFLYLLAQCGTDKPDHIPLPSETIASLSYSMYVEHSGTSSFEVVVNPAGQLNMSMMGQPGGVPALGEDGKLDESTIPDSVAKDEDLVTKPSYIYVTNNTNITQILTQTGITPFWSLFSSPQGPSTNACMYFTYPILDDKGAATGDVFIEAFDLTEFKSYIYKGASNAVSSSKWVQSGGAGGSQSYLVTCSTAAGTGAKTATIEDFELVAGVSLFVKFANANTASTVTLNVSGTGAKPIVDKTGTVISSINSALLTGTCLFVYDGTSYVLTACVANGTTFGSVKLSDTRSQTDASAGIAATPKMVDDAVKNMKAPKWGTCTTAAATAAKVATVDDFTLVTGASVLLYVSTANSVVSPTLNVNSTGAKAIVDKNGTALTSTTAPLFGGLCLLAYNGTNWVLLDSMGNSSLFGSVKLSDSTSSTYAASAGVAATPKAAKAAYDLANTKAVKVLYTGTLTTEWTATDTGYTQTLTVNGVLASDTPVIGIVQTSTVATNQTLLENWALVSRITTAANSITAYAYGDAPTVALPIQILCVR